MNENASFYEKKRHTGFFILLLMLFVLLCGCQASQETASETYSAFSELENKRIGAATGSIQAIEIEKRFPNAEILYFQTGPDMVNALKSDRIDAFGEAEALVRYMMSQEPSLTYLKERLGTTVEAGAIFPKTGEGRKLCEDFSSFIQESKESGLYDSLQEIWYGDDESRRVVPGLKELTGENGTLRMAFDPSMCPFIYIKDGEPVGIDLDLAVRFCKIKGYRLEPVSMDFSGIIPSIVSGKCDFACGGVAYTEERAESVYFAEPSYIGGSVVCVLKSSTDSGNIGFWTSVKESFEKTFIREKRWKLFLTGIGNTLMISILSLQFGTLLGFLVYNLCRRGNRAANTLTKAAIWLIQGMPVVILLMVLYYIVFGSLDLAGFWVAVIAFSLIFGSGMFAMLVSGVKAVDFRQTEAAYALGYTDKMAFRKIILPQAAAHFLPAYRAEAVALIKATAVVGYITVLDLTRIGDIIRSRTLEAFFPLIAITIIYFLIETVFRRAVNILIRHYDPKRRSKEQILKGG